jgi:hypothetical protein
MEKDLLTALIPTGVSTGRFGGEIISLLEKTAFEREVFHRRRLFLISLQQPQGLLSVLIKS